MRCQYIDTGRFEHPTIWINDFKPLASYPYPTSGDNLVALNIGQAIELYKELSLALIEAGQGGMLTANLTPKAETPV